MITLPIDSWSFCNFRRIVYLEYVLEVDYFHRIMLYSIITVDQFQDRSSVIQYFEL